MTNQQFTLFKNLHKQFNPLILLNSWDAASSVMLQQIGVKAIATSSASLAWANGYADGSQLPLNTHLAAIKQILRVIDIPLTVDIEAGYSDSPETVAAMVMNLAEMGVSGINIEDGDQSPELLVEKIAAIKAATTAKHIFINARTDVFLRGLVSAEQAVAESVCRMEKYVLAGADCGFVPGVTATTEVAAIVQQVAVPVNVMLAAVDEDPQPMVDAGVSRISYGPAPFLAVYNHLSKIGTNILGLAAKDEMTYATINQAME